MELKHKKHVSIRKCNCGADVCDQYFISSTNCEGRLDHADALLYTAAPEMLEVLIHEYKMMCTYCGDAVCDHNREPGEVCGVEIKRIIEKATGMTIDEVINGITK